MNWLNDKKLKEELSGSTIKDIFIYSYLVSLNNLYIAL